MPQLDPIVKIAWESSTQPGTVNQSEPLRQRVLSLDYTDKTKGADTFSISLQNDDLSLLDDSRLAEGNNLHVQFGYPGMLSPNYVVTIKKVTGWKDIRIEGESTSEARFISSQKTRVFEQQTAWQVAETIARELGYSNPRDRVINPPTDAETEDFNQAGETDYAFLQRIAERYGHVFRISGGKFHFHEPSLDSEPLLTIRYWDDPEGVFVGEPSITEGTLGRPGRVTRRGYNPRSRQRTEGTAGNEDDSDRPVLGEVSPVRDPGRNSVRSESERASSDDEYLMRWIMNEHEMSIMPGPQDSMQSTSDSTDTRAQQRARGQFRRAERKAIKMNWPLVGMPGLKADTVVRLEGVPDKLVGNYWVEEAKHSISSSGYSTTVKVNRNARSRSSTGARMSRAQNMRQQQRVQNQIAALNRRRASNQIDMETYNRRWNALNDRLTQLRSIDQASDSTGRQNTGEARDTNDLRQTEGTDPETGRRRVQFSRDETEDNDVFTWLDRQEQSDQTTWDE